MRTGASGFVSWALVSSVVMPLVTLKRLRRCEKTSLLGVALHGTPTDADDEHKEHQKVYQPHNVIQLLRLRIQ